MTALYMALWSVFNVSMSISSSSAVSRSPTTRCCFTQSLASLICASSIPSNCLSEVQSASLSHSVSTFSSSKSSSSGSGSFMSVSLMGSPRPIIQSSCSTRTFCDPGAGTRSSTLTNSCSTSSSVIFRLFKCSSLTTFGHLTSFVTKSNRAASALSNPSIILTGVAPGLCNSNVVSQYVGLNFSLVGTGT